MILIIAIKYNCISIYEIRHFDSPILTISNLHRHVLERLDINDRKRIVKGVHVPS